MYGLRRFGIKLGLETISTVLAGLGLPQNQYRIIHIAGTNGKGSVAAMLATILQEAGYRVGRYTSPHLERFNERICIDNVPIDDPAVVSAYDHVRSVQGLDRELTFFECTTAMALHEFARQSVDWAVIETGMGGRLDATNAVTPDYTVITNISLEHKSYLGNTLAAIAGEKAGIIKAETPLVTAVSQPAARRVILDRARKLNSPVLMKGRDFRYRRMDAGYFSYYGPHRTWRQLKIGLRGTHQIENASLVLATCETMVQTGRIKLSDDAIRRGLGRTLWPGRLEVVSDKPMVILDGAHNLMAARKLAEYLRDRFPDRRITLVIGVLDDKACEPILKDLIAPSRHVVVTQPVIDRAIPAADLAAVAGRYSDSIEIIPDVGHALEQALKRSGDNDVVCVAGSLYVVGEAKTALRKMALS